jgi:hypothetical protein
MVITAVVTEEEASLLLAPQKTTFSLPHAEKSNGKIVLIRHEPSKKVKFGAEVYGINLNNFTDADFDFIHDALHRHKLLVFKEQPAMLKPEQQYKLTSRYIPIAHGFFW